MKIKKLETFVVQAGWRPWAFLKISSDEGVVGYADCTDANASLLGVIAAIQDFEPYLLGKSAEHIELISDDLYRITRQSAGGVVQKAIAGVQNALLDLKARALGVPVFSLLGGPVRRRIPLYWSHCGSTRLRAHQYLGEVPKVASLMDIRDLGQEVVERGFYGLKTNLLIFPEDSGTPWVVSQGFKGGEGSSDRNVSNEIIRGVTRLMEAFRSGIGPDIDLILDINMHFRADGVQRLARALESFNLTWLEVDMDDPLQLAAFRRKAPMPIGSCEKRQLMAEYLPFLVAYAMDIAIVDVRWAGVWEAKKLADLAKCYEINIAPHNHGSPLATLMAAHLCASITNLKALEYDVDDVSWRDDIVVAPPRIESGQLILPEGPGWGTELNETLLAKLTL